jgi:hypothetical protein
LTEIFPRGFCASPADNLSKHLLSATSSGAENALPCAQVCAIDYPNIKRDTTRQCIKALPRTNGFVREAPFEQGGSHTFKSINSFLRAGRIAGSVL